VIALIATSLVRSCFNLSVKTYITFAISSGDKIVFETEIRSAAAIILFFLTS